MIKYLAKRREKRNIKKSLLIDLEPYFEEGLKRSEIPMLEKSEDRFSQYNGNLQTYIDSMFISFWLDFDWDSDTYHLTWKGREKLREFKDT